MKTLLLSAIALLLMQVNLIADAIPAARRIAWDPGVRGDIPTVSTIFATVTSSIPGTNIVAVGDGVNESDGLAIQAALGLCPSNQVVYLPAGTYRVTNALTMSRNGVVLRGAGQGATRILFDRGSPSGKIGIQIMDNSGVAATYDWTNGFTAGSSNLILTSVSSISTGTVVICASSNTIAYGSTPQNWPVPLATGSTNNTGTVETYLGYPLGTGTHSLGHHAIVQGISGTTITVWPPLPIDYNGTNALVFRMGAPGIRIGIESLTVDRYATNSNVGDKIVMYRALNSWIYDVGSSNSSSTHIRVNKSLWCTVRKCYMSGADGYTGSTGYGLETKLYTTRCLFEDNIFERCLNSIHFSECSSQNVFAYNFETNNVGANATNRMGIDTGANHGAHPCMNLFEGNKSEKFYADFIHGTSSHGVALRNWFRGWGTNNANPNRSPTLFEYATHAVVLEAGARYYSFVGNVLGWTNKDPAISWRSNTYQFTNNFPLIDYRVPASWVVGVWNAGGTNGATLWDDTAYTTLIRSNNLVCINTDTSWSMHTNEWNPAAITNSYYLSSKPSWYGTWTWPGIGPDLSNALNVLPAEARLLGLTDTPVAPPMPPADSDTTPINRIPALQFQQTPNGLKQPATRRFIIPSQS